MKLHAFTLIEVIIAMIVSMIVVFIAYTVYFLSYKQLNDYKNMNEKILKTFQLNTMMQDDFDKAVSILCEGNELNLILNNGQTCKYLFSSDEITRQTKITSDTFKYKLADIQNSFNKKNVSLGIIDELNFICYQYGDSLRFSFYKQYPPDVFIELEEINKSNKMIILK